MAKKKTRPGKPPDAKGASPSEPLGNEASPLTPPETATTSQAQAPPPETAQAEPPPEPASEAEAPVAEAPKDETPVPVEAAEGRAGKPTSAPALAPSAPPAGDRRPPETGSPANGDRGSRVLNWLAAIFVVALIGQAAWLFLSPPTPPASTAPAMAKATGGPAPVPPPGSPAPPQAATQVQPPVQAGPLTYEDWPTFLRNVMALENSKTPLTDEQKAKLKKQAPLLLEATTKGQQALRKALAVLDDKQLAELQQGHPVGQMERGAGDPYLSVLLPLLQKKAGSSAAPPRATPPAATLVIRRDRLLEGFIHLAKTSLTPEQAKSMLDAMQDLAAQDKVMAAALKDVQGILVYDQLSTIAQMSNAYLDESLAAQTLVLWAKKK